MTARRALICGISGQDGAWLARCLLDRGYDVFGTARDVERAAFSGLVELGIRDRVRVLSMLPGDAGSVRRALDAVRPDEIYNLAGQSSVGLSFAEPLPTFEGIALGTLNLLEAVRSLARAAAAK